MFIAFFLCGLDILRGGGYDLDEQALVLFIIIGEQAADGIDYLVMVFEKAAEIGVRTGLFFGSCS